MRCARCEAKIDPETDRHLVVREELVAPDLGLEGVDGGALCESCMNPEVATLAPEG
jgi:hypothetical protein